MAHSLSAQKRIRQNAKRRAANRRRKDTVRTAVKELRDLIATHGTPAECEAKLKAVVKILDQAGSTSAYHKKTTSRYKSRLALAVNKKKAGKAA